MGMTTTPAKALSTPQLTTLTTLVRNGGEMNAYAGQAGFNCHSVAPLVRLGLVERVASCDNCLRRPTDKHAAACTQPLKGQKGGQQCYDRIRVTAAGREHLIASTIPTAVLIEEINEVIENLAPVVEPIAEPTAALTWSQQRAGRHVAETATHTYEILSATPRYWSVLVREHGSPPVSVARGLDDMWAARRAAQSHAAVEPTKADIADLIEEVEPIARPAMSAADLYGQYLWTCDICDHELVRWAVRKNGKLVRPEVLCRGMGCEGSYILAGPYGR